MKSTNNSNYTPEILKSSIRKIAEVYIAGTDMQSSLIVLLNKSAGKVMECLREFTELSETYIFLNLTENSKDSVEEPQKTITVFMENEKSRKIINYTYMTNLSDSPTTRLIALKKLHSKHQSELPSTTQVPTYISSYPMA